MEKIWKDFHLRMVIYFFLSISLISFVIYYYFYKQPGWNELLLSLFILIFSIFILFNIVKTKLTYITSGGVRIGNAQEDSYERFNLKKETIFINWEEVKEIKIIRKVTKRSFREILIDYIVIKTRDNEKYESFIANPNGFLKTLKKLNKGRLVSKDSRYYELIKSPQ